MITLHKHDISANIKDRYANIVYSFDFENTNKFESDELKFEITIDPQAFISSFEANIDGVLFYGQTKQKQKAQKEYVEAQKNDENAILISQPYDDIPNVFEIKTNIDSKSKISLNITIQHYLTKKFSSNVLNIQILRNFYKYNIKPNFEFISFKLDIKDQSGIYDVDIPSSFVETMNENHIIIDGKTMDELNQNYIINGKILSKSSINELVLKYKINGEQNDSHILFDNKSNTFCHIISDIITDSMIDIDDIDGGNEEIKENILIPRRAVFVIDKSGSMNGSKWNKTVTATIEALTQLRSSYDRFCIILFNDDIHSFPENRGIICANTTNINKSIQYLQNQIVGGGTNINDPLMAAIEIIKTDIKLCKNHDKYNYFMNQIIFLTDGEVSDTKQIILNVKTVNNLSDIDKYNSKISIFSFGVGKDENDSSWLNEVNHSFLKVLSLNNNGFYKRIKQTSADVALKQYFSILSQPVLSNINVEYNHKNITNLTETKFNTLYSGNDLIICGKINHPNIINNFQFDVTITATTGKEIQENDKLLTKPINIRKEFKITINNEDNNDGNNVDRIWAYLTLQQFANKKLIQNDMIEMDDDEKKENDSFPLSLAMTYKFVTPWTSMIVVQRKDIHPISNDFSALQLTPKQRAERKQRPSMQELELRGIAPSGYFNEEPQNRRKPTITDLGDMHIIPHDYLDNLLEDAVANHQRKVSRMDHVQNRLQKHLPEAVAQTLAETLVTSVQDDDNDNDNDSMDEDEWQQTHVNNEDDEWQISFIYEPMHNFIPMDTQQKNEVTNNLERRLSSRPSVIEISDRGLIPEQWLIDLYGLADQVRKKHGKMESAVLDLKSHLNIPPILADVVARDVLDEIENVDPYLKNDDDNNNYNNNNSDNMNKLRGELEELKESISFNEDKITSLSETNNKFKNELNAIKQSEETNISKITSLESRISISSDQKTEIRHLRQQQHSIELNKLDSKALEIELSKERLTSQQLTDANNELEQELLHYRYKMNELEEIMEQFVNDKIELIKNTNQQIDELRGYLCEYKKYTKQENKNDILSNDYWCHSTNPGSIRMENKFVNKIKNNLRWDHVFANGVISQQTSNGGNDKKFIEWTIKIKNINNESLSTIIIGISSHLNGVQFGFDNIGNILYQNNIKKDINKNLQFKSNDTVHLILDFSNQNYWILYAKIADHVDNLCIFNKITPNSYRLAISLLSQMDSVKIKSAKIQSTV